MGFSRQEYWSGLPCPSPGDLPYPGIEPRSPAWQVDSLPAKPTAFHIYNIVELFCCLNRFLPPLQVSAVESLEGPLLQVEGLSDLRLELHSKKMNLHLVLIDELHRHLYIKSTSRVVQQNKEKGRMRLVKKALCHSVL